ncbi:MAG TPA: N-acetylmuramidase [Gallionella sp.]|jgi:lysozyme family protein|nr:MAG: N-acetylmuramidase [Gallionellales bacterium GWA2_54_124]OGT18111.1 MAG: N-acetylmuramidase [Gallionellales bacterium RIFOXYD12_FULL_53_10]OGT41259.1 MAG: N-acetylmuramidase [Gallionellales bacterium RIFOXYD2_FULL_52_7]HCI51883.1 N-acetylmuramidase [Gallionella sp.]
MAEFASAYTATCQAEGGYVNDPQDPGGETYQGIARKLNSKWDGWILIDRAKQESAFPANLDRIPELQEKIKSFFEINYWNKLRGGDMTDQRIAQSIFDFAVNAGTYTSAKLAQLTVGEKPDGIIGPETLKKINATDPGTFLARFSLHKIARYISICEQRPDSKKYFFGWVKRTLEGVGS